MQKWLRYNAILVTLIAIFPRENVRGTLLITTLSTENRLTAGKKTKKNRTRSGHSHKVAA